MTLRVFIEGNGNAAYQRMWKSFGAKIVDDIHSADVIQFTGGEDVDPALYDEARHPRTGCYRPRDELCMDLFKFGVDKGLPMAGICRGGQFLNVASSGKMFQHCDGHAIHGTHKATILESGLVVDVTSTHHQIMRPNRDKGIVLMEANPKLGTFKEHMVYDGPLSRDGWIREDLQNEDDIEAVFYPDTMSLCFQPHPEYCDPQSSCVLAYRSFLRNYLELAV